MGHKFKMGTHLVALVCSFLSSADKVALYTERPQVLVAELSINLTCTWIALTESINTVS